VQRLFTALLAALFAANATLCTRADDQFPTLQIGGTTYTNVTVLNHDATEIYFRHAGGLGNVPLRALTPELQKQFNYDPARAKAIEKQREASRNDYPAYAFRNAVIRASAARDLSLFTETTNVPLSLADACSDKSLLGKTAPPITVEKWFVEKTAEATTAPPAARHTLIFFYQATSEPCRRAAESVNQLAKLYPDQLRVIGLTTETNDDASLALTFPHGSDSHRATADAADVTSLPSVLLIDPKNIVRYSGHPAALNDDAFAKLLAQ
jgi:thiol-disulfide isomerase/thioredoxin